MFVQSSTFLFYSLSFIVFLFVSVNGQLDDCMNICPEARSGGGTWVSVLRSNAIGTSVQLIWEPYEKNPLYQIQYRTVEPANSPTNNITVENNNTYVLTDLQPGTDYKAQVCLIAVDPPYCGGCVLCFTTGFDPVPPTQPSLTGSTMSSLTVRLTWEPPVGSITSYIITYFPVNEPSQHNTVPVAADSITIIVGNLSPNTTYRFEIQAINDYGTSLPSNPVILNTSLQSDSPGYLLFSDAHGISFYFTLSAKVAASTTFTDATEEDFILADGISGIGFYPNGSTGGYIFTSSSNGLITKHDTILQTSVGKDSGTINVTSNSEVLNRAPAQISLITVDWVNDMLYWLERVNNNVTIRHSLLNGSEVDCVTTINANVNVTGIEVDPIHGYLYWSVQGPSGGIFQLDLTLAKTSDCVSPASNVVNIIFNDSVDCMNLNLEDSLLYFATGSVNFSSVSLEDGQIVNYPHSFIVPDARSIASYNEYLVVPATSMSDNNDFSAAFVKIRQQDSTQSIVIVTTTPPTDTNHVFIIREDFQPSPEPPGAVDNAGSLPTTTSINFSWSPPPYADSRFGPSAFNRWTYTLDLLNTSNTVMGTKYQYNSLLPNTVYVIDIFPSLGGAVDNAGDELVSSWIVETVNDVTPVPNVILGGSSGIYTALMNERQVMQQITADRQSVGMTYDFHRNTLYWTTNSRLLVQLSLNGGNPVQKTLRNDLLDPTSIGVDYIGQRLYWIGNANTIQYVLLDSADNDVHVMVELSDIDDFTDLAIDSPSGLLFWAHNGGTRGISVLRLNGVGDEMVCVTDNNQPCRYHAITVDTENKRIFWIKETAGSFMIGMADYFENGSCINHVNKMIVSEPSVESSTDRISMTYIAGILLYTSSTLPNMIFVTASNFSSFPSADYQLAVGQYNISTGSGDINIQSIIANQTSQQYLPDNVGLDVLTVRPSVPVNIHLDDSSSTTSINITWDMVVGVSPDIVTYLVTYSLSRTDGSTEDNVVLKTDNNYFVLTDQSPETTLNVSVVAYTRWYSSDMSAVVTIISDSGLPSRIEQSSVSVYRRERGSDQLSALLTWTGLTIEQAGGLLINYTVSLYTISQSARTLSRNIPVDPSEAQVELTDLMANQMYSFTVRAVNRAGSGMESEEVMFSTNGPQSPMELIAIGSGGVASMLRDNQLIALGDLRYPLAIDSRQSIVYYVDSDNLMSVNLNIPNSAEVLFPSLSMVSDLALDWVGRRLYIVQIGGTDLTIQALALDMVLNDQAELYEVKRTVVQSNATVKITLSPYTGQLYWIEASPSVTGLYQHNLGGSTTQQLYSSNSRRRRNPMCPDSSGLETIGDPLTTALTYDAITDRLWLATTAGDIWSCDLDGCDCSREVHGTSLLQSGTISDIGLPTDSVSLDSVNIYWSGPTGVFSVPRIGATVALRVSDSDTSSIITTDPGQQPLAVESCLYPALTREAQPTLLCPTMADSNDSLSISWTPPEVTASCQDQLYAFPTLSYRVTYHIAEFPFENGEIDDIFSSSTTLRGLLSFTNYNISVKASNVYTPSGVAVNLNYEVCTTEQGLPSPVRNLQASPASTTEMRVTWLRPFASGTVQNMLSYNISLDGEFREMLNDSTTEYVIRNLTAGLDQNYTIKVIATNSLGASGPQETIGFPYPLPPVPMIKFNDDDICNVTVRILLTLFFSHKLINVSLVLAESSGGNPRSIMLPSDTVYPSETFVTLYPLLPATNYTLSTLAVYPNGESNTRLTSDSIYFTTCDGVPGIPVISLADTILLWSRPAENGEPITYFTLRLMTSDIDRIDVSNRSLSEFTYDLTPRLTRGVETTVSLSATNAIGNSNYSETLTITIPLQGEGDGQSEQLNTGVLIGIIAGASVFAIIVLITIIVLCYCYRLRPKNYDYAFRVEVPYDMELRKLRLTQMRMANNDLYSPNYNADDVETLKKFPRDRIKLEKLLGRGAFGEVWAGIATDIMGPGTGPHPVALKTLQKNATESDQRSFLSEAIVMSNFDHPNVLPVLGVCLNNNPFFLILELMEAGDLLAFLRGARQENGPPLLTIDELVKIALDVANGARYLETQHFVHRDLAARNCLVSSKGPDRVVKIGDFGLARDVYHSDYYRKEGQGLLPVRWMAPESLLDGKFTVDSDIWSYGILLWEITTLGRQPYPARSNQEVFQFVIGGGRCDKPDNCHPKLYRLMRQCWAHRPEERPRFTVIVDTLTRLHDRLVEGNESTSSEESEFEEEEPRYTIQPRGSGGRRSLRSSIRSGASNIVSGIVNLTRAGSMRMRNSIRRQGSLRRQDEINEARAATAINRGRSVSSSEQQLLPEPPLSGSDHLADDSAGADQSMNKNTKEQNGFREIGPF